MKKVVVGMSGGVDSSVAAWLLKEKGYEVVGVTMLMWQEENAKEDGSCGGLCAVEDAKRVAERLGIEHRVINFGKQFKEKVVDYFVDSYVKGQTPNPCNACNRFVKWEALLEYAESIGAEYIATGHYARIDKLENGRFAIRNSVTAAKDQTYALYNLTQKQLAHTLMPVGEYTKDQIREFAGEIGLVVADKPDSQDICFIPDHDYAGFVEKYAAKDLPKTGNFVSTTGEILGKHKGIIHYTVGQRKGLNLAMGRPVFVTEIRPLTNEVVIGEAEDVFAEQLFCNKVNYMGMEKPEQGQKVLAKIRYAHKGTYCTLWEESDGRIRCDFDEPVRAVTPGQSVVFYDGEYVLGGGTIIS